MRRPPFTATDLATGRVTRFDVYHTGERFLFLDMLHRIAHRRIAEAVLADVAHIRDDLTDRTNDLTATSRSENNFDDLLPCLPAILVADPANNSPLPPGVPRPVTCSRTHSCGSSSDFSMI